MRVKVIADVHGDIDTVKREAASCDALLLLGDLINIVDYENAGGILAEVYGSQAVRTWSALRAEGKIEDSRKVLAQVAQGREQELRAELVRRIDEAHREFCSQVPHNVVLTFGNVDVPDLIRQYLPTEVRFVEHGVVRLGPHSFGIVGGGLPKVGIPGEVALDVYETRVKALGPVDVLCAHVPPALGDLTYDVRAKFSEPGSVALLDYIDAHSPSHVYFGHVHAPRAARLEVGSSLCVNVGHHYRATGEALTHPVSKEETA